MSVSLVGCFVQLFRSHGSFATGPEELAYLVGMRRSNKQHGTSLRNTPGATGHDLTEEHVDDVADGIEEEIILPVHHGI